LGSGNCRILPLTARPPGLASRGRTRLIVGDEAELAEVRWASLAEADTLLPGYQWRRVRAAAGCAGIRLHDLRHFYASGLIAAGCDVVTVQRALGHKSASVTLNTYSHLWPSAEDRTRSAAAAMLAEALGTDSAADHSRTGGGAQ
jgi:integrase